MAAAVKTGGKKNKKCCVVKIHQQIGRIDT